MYLKRDENYKKGLLASLKTVEGQVRGIAKMVEEDRYCVDILIQLASIRAGINKVGLSVLENHTRGCVTMAIREGKGNEYIDELVDVLSKFVK